MVWGMLSVEKREAELTQKLEQVHVDKGKIEDTIEQLDEYKLDALKKTWKKVSKCVFFLIRSPYILCTRMLMGGATQGLW